MKADVNTK